MVLFHLSKLLRFSLVQSRQRAFFYFTRFGSFFFLSLFCAFVVYTALGSASTNFNFHWRYLGGARPQSGPAEHAAQHDLALRKHEGARNQSRTHLADVASLHSSYCGVGGGGGGGAGLNEGGGFLMASPTSPRQIGHRDDLSTSHSPMHFSWNLCSLLHGRAIIASPGEEPRSEAAS